MLIPLLLAEKLEDLPNKCKLTPGKRGQSQCLLLLLTQEK